MVDALPATPGFDTDELLAARYYLDAAPIPEDLRARLADPARVAGLEQRRAKQQADDWACLGRYREANRLVTDPPLCVLLGDSLSENWVIADPMLADAGIVGRGIGGQTTPQILLRFIADAAALRPRVVHLLAGTNDIAGNSGPTTLGEFQSHFTAMVDLAEHHGIAVIIGLLPPFTRFAWAPAIDPAPWVIKINAWLRETAAARGHVIADYHAALSGGGGMQDATIAPDGVHPSRKGYAIMRPVLDAALDRAAPALERSGTRIGA